MLSPGDIRKSREWCDCCDDLTEHETTFLRAYDGWRGWSLLTCVPCKGSA